MDLIGLVIAGQCVHHKIDPETVCHFALALAARHGRIQRLTVVIGRPGGRPVGAGFTVYNPTRIEADRAAGLETHAAPVKLNTIRAAALR